MVILGRNYANSLIFDHLEGQEKRAFLKGKLNLESIDATTLEKTKVDVERQVKITQDLGLTHLELDASIASPFLKIEAGRRKQINELAKSGCLTLSVNLPCSFADGGVCSLKEENRKSIVELQKLCAQFASDIGAKYVNLYPGSVPSERTAANYKELTRAPLIKSLMELGKFASELGLVLNMENNSGFDGIYCEIGDCLSVVKEVREHDVPIYFNYDIGNWLKRAESGAKIPSQPESSLELIPPEYIKELHLNDYVPGERISHPPIHLEWGMLKHANLERFARLAKERKVETVVLETEMKSIEQALDFKNILRAESDYVLDLFR